MDNYIYDILNSLKKRLDKNSQLVVNLFDDFSFNANFKFNNSANIEDIQKFSNINNIDIPDDYDDYKDFLLLNNGAELFKSNYEVPIKLYSLDEIEHFINKVPKCFFPIGYYPDTGFIMINNNSCKNRDVEYMWLLDTDPINLKCNFKTWLNRIIVVQGMNYWEWKSEVVPIDKILKN